jgi:alpha-amylase
MHNLQFCRLAGLADLNTESAYVQQEMNKWINWLVKEYQFDGIRIDTIVEVPTFFWKSFTQASGVFSIGEAFDGD